METPLQRTEKRLIAPVYDALETSNFSLALVQCDRLLPRFKTGSTCHILSAIRAYTLAKLDRRQEANEDCNKMKNMKPQTEEALRWARNALTELGREEEYPAIVQVAFDQHPTDGSLGMSLVLAYVRLRDWENLQKSSFKMHSSFKDPRMMYFSAMSLYLQAKEAPVSAPARLALADRLLSAPGADPTKTPLHLQFTISLKLALAQSSNPKSFKPLQDAYEILQSPGGLATGRGQLEVEEVRWEVVRLLGELEDSTEGESKGVWELEWERLNNRVRGTEDVKDLNHLTYLHLIDLAVLLAPRQPSFVSRSRAAFEAMDAELGAKERSPVLASLELERRLAAELPALAIAGATAALRIRYFDLFATKACCFEDLKPFFPIESEEVAELRQYLQGVISSKPSSTKEVITHVNAQKCLRYLSEASKLDAEAEVALSRDLLELYRTSLAFGKDLLKTELQPADDLALLAANGLVRAWSISGDLTLLYEAMVVLEHAQRASHQNHYVRILLIRLYRLIGATSLPQALYAAIKPAAVSVQADTLSHLVISRIKQQSESANAEIFTSSSSYYRQTDVDVPELLVRAFIAESFPQIVDFLDFHGRLRKSLQREILSLEDVRQSMLGLKAAVTPRSDLARLSESLAVLPEGELSDNRDFTLTPSYQPRGVEVDDLTATGPLPNGAWLHSIHSAYLGVLSAASRSNDKAQAPPNGLIVADSLTIDETFLKSLADALSAWSEVLDGAQAPTSDPASVIVAAFADQSQRVKNLIKDASSPGWELLHASSTILEAFVLLEILISRHRPVGKGKKAPPLPESLLSVLIPIKASLRSTAALLRTTADTVGSSAHKAEMAKSLPGLVPFGVSENFALDVVAKAGSSRKAALLSVAKALTERTSR